jgi:hypothetical protein
MEKFENGDLVAIIWEDSSSHSGWTWPPVGLEIGTVRSCGIVVEASETQIIITTAMNDEGAVMSPLAVPVSAIKEIRKLE